MTAEREWEPGDPLFPNRHVSHQGYFFNFRQQFDSDECACPDRASWPKPAFWSHDLSRQPDELEAFIREYHEWKDNG